jgi:formylglycine-generating enzyme required for sulfatase activity
MLEGLDRERKPRIFLCHAHEDKERVKELYHRLKKAGYHPWLDKYDLLPGQNWRGEIRKMLSDHNNLVVVCLSNSSVTKRGTVQREIKWALDLLEEMPEGAIYLIPARLESCQVPDRLSELHWVDLFEPDGFEYLTRSLDFEIANRKPPAEPEKVKAPDVEISKQPVPPTSARQPFEPELVHIPAGEFLMGSDPEKDKNASPDEEPQHRLHLPDYYIAKTPVTNAQYAVFAKATDRRTPPAGKEHHPVVNVSWRDAMAYCQWLAEATGKAYRLPSEAEWEKAARGTDGRIWPWGNEPPDKNRCNFNHNVDDITPVGQYSPQGDSPYGCVDMAGNVWEWTLSLWGRNWEESDFKYPYDPTDGREDLKASNDILRVLRGGAFNIDVRYVVCACRDGDYPDDWDDFIGFRLCVAPSDASDL